MFTEKFRAKLIGILEKKQTELESQILDCGNKELAINGDKDNYTRLSGAGTSRQYTDFSTINAYKKRLIITLERVVIRIDALKNFVFNGVCPQCGRNILQKDLKINPLMPLCAKCQAEINKNK